MIYFRWLTYQLFFLLFARSKYVYSFVVLLTPILPHLSLISSHLIFNNNIQVRFHLILRLNKQNYDLYLFKFRTDSRHGEPKKG